MIQLNKEDRKRLKDGDTTFLIKTLSDELDNIKNELLTYKRDDAQSYDLVLKGRGLLLDELIKLLKN